MLTSFAFLAQPAYPSAAPTQINPAGPAGPAGKTGAAGANGRNGVDGAPGAPGRNGVDGAGTTGSRVASTSIPASTFVVDNGDGTCSVADPNNAAHKGRVLGLVAAAANAGGVATFVNQGAVAGVTGTFSATDGTLFIGDGTTGRLGSIVNVSPRLTTAAWIQTVGTPTSGSSVNLLLGEAGALLVGGVPVYASAGATTLSALKDATSAFLALNVGTPDGQRAALGAAAAAAVYGPRDLGAAGNGTANDNAAFAQALTVRGQDLFVQAGTYIVSLADGASLGTLLGGTNVRGAGRDVTQITFRTTTTTYLTVLSVIASSVRFSDIHLRLECLSGQTASLFAIGGGARGLTFERCRLSANGTVVSGAPTCYPMLINVGGNFDDLRLIDCEVDGWCYPFLKTNTSTAANRNWSVRGGKFHDNQTGDITFNSPNGVFDGVEISGVTFTGGLPQTNDAGLHAAISMASVTNVRIIGCDLSGYTSGEMIHIEESCGKVIISGNVLQPTSTRAKYGKGIAVLNNNVSGARHFPSEIIIDSNIIIRGDGVDDGTGIDIVYDNTGTTGGSRYLISGNIVRGFKYGLNIPQLPYNSKVAGNVLTLCDVGVYAYSGSLAIRDNTIEACGQGIYSLNGGMFGRQTFIAVPTLAAAQSGLVVLRGWSQEYEATNGAAGANTLFDLGSIGVRLKGTARVLARGSVTLDKMFGEYPLAFDGTTLTAGTAALEYTSGGAIGISTGEWSVTAGTPKHLQLGVYNGQSFAQTLAVHVDFDGEQVF